MPAEEKMERDWPIVLATCQVALQKRVEPESVLGSAGQNHTWLATCFCVPPAQHLNLNLMSGS